MFAVLIENTKNCDIFSVCMEQRNNLTLVTETAPVLRIHMLFLLFFSWNLLTIKMWNISRH